MQEGKKRLTMELDGESLRLHGTETLGDVITIKRFPGGKLVLMAGDHVTAAHCLLVELKSGMTQDEKVLDFIRAAVGNVSAIRFIGITDTSPAGNGKLSYYQVP
ncbi:hypothetical protein LJC55_02985 [Eubacteriales bacterium OttesenSCG-928-N14]|nr:hypothetical protein [Eubacteriales bacterium OttesenSCG-928-N14]